MPARRLLRGVGGGVAANHVRAGVAKEVLHVELAGILFYRPGGESVAEAVGVDLGHPGLAAPAPQHLLEAVGAQGDPGPQPTVGTGTGDEEQRSRVWSSDLEVDIQGIPAPRREGHYPLLVPLSAHEPE